MELPRDPDGHNGEPSPGQPNAAVVLVVAAGPEGNGLEPLQSPREGAPHKGPGHGPESSGLGLSSACTGAAACARQPSARQ
eukprot:13691750-Alexandrium_andersonii.AAC.1